MRQGLTTETIDIMIASLAKNSIKQYDCALKKWWDFCVQNKVDYYVVNIPSILNFFTQLFQAGASYSTLNTVRSALALILGKEFSRDERVLRFLKGVFKGRPMFPKYHTTWNPNLVLDFLSNWYPNESLPLDKLSKKLVALLALSTAQRVQTLSLIRLSNITANDQNFEIIINDVIKTSAPNRQMPRLVIPLFPHKVQICPGKTLTSYIEATKPFRLFSQTEKLILTTKKPIHNASASTISRWIKNVLEESGVDTTIFTAHSTRHASTSAAGRRGISVDLIKKSAGWSDNSLVFAKFYNRPLHTCEGRSFAEAIYSDSD